MPIESIKYTKKNIYIDVDGEWILFHKGKHENVRKELRYDQEKGEDVKNEQ